MRYILAVILIFLAMPAYSYLDSGTVSIILQSFLGGLAVTIATLSLFWRKICNFLFGKKSKTNIEKQIEGQESE